MYGYDAISANIGAIPAGANYVFGYVTGSSYIVWSQQDFNRFPNAVKEYIDQGNGVPWRAPTIIDIENGAHRATDLPRLARLYKGVKVYCNQSTLPSVYATGWRGKVWVAAPGSDANTVVANVERDFKGLTVFAVQDYWQRVYDRTTIISAPVITPPVKTIDIDGFKVPRPTPNNVPVVISWWGDSGIVRRLTTFNTVEWDLIKWHK